MGFFFNYKDLKKTVLKEAEIDGQPATEEEQTPDYNAEDQQQDQAPATEQPADQQQDPQPEENQNPEEQPPAEEPPVDYNQMDEDQGGGEMPPEDGGQPQEAPPADNSNSQEESEVDDIKRQEEDLYENLTPEQLDIKHKELKMRYLEMFDTTTSVIDRIGDVAATEDNIEIVKFVSEKLSSLRDMLTDYINSVYKTKSYIENYLNYNKFLAVLNGINEILEEMNKKGS